MSRSGATGRAAVARVVKYGLFFSSIAFRAHPQQKEHSRMAPSPAKPFSITYADAGVDIERAHRTKQRIKFLAHKTFTRGVLSEIGGFGGLFALDKKRYRDPVLVSSVDGVGTKLKVAFAMDLHHTVGGDLVNHCVNDIAVQGATPLLDRKSTRLNSSHIQKSRMPSSA